MSQAGETKGGGAAVQRVLMTGGGGFLGAWIIRHLRQHRVDVRIFELKEDRRMVDIISGDTANYVEWISGDVSDTAAMIEAAEGCTGIVHLAGLQTPACKQNPLLGAKVNVIGTLNAFEAAKAHDINHVIYTSSGGVYGPEDGQPPFPTSHYGAFKLANEGNARAYWEDAGISSTGFRPFVVYGPGRDVGLTTGITTACRAAAEGTEYTVGVSGPMALVYVEDVALAYISALLNAKGGAQTVDLTGQLTSVEEAVDIIQDIVPGARISIEGNPIPSNSGAPNQWRTCGLELPEEHSLRQGIEKTIGFYREQMSHPASRG